MKWYKRLSPFEWGLVVGSVPFMVLWGLLIGLTGLFDFSRSRVERAWEKLRGSP